MKAAWTIYKNENADSWSESLKKAWAWAKKNLVEGFYTIHSIKKETEKAVLAVVGKVFNHCLEDFQDVTMWVPKSLIVNNSIPEWFYKKNK